MIVSVVFVIYRFNGKIGEIDLGICAAYGHIKLLVDLFFVLEIGSPGRVLYSAAGIACVLNANNARGYRCGFYTDNVLVSEITCVNAYGKTVFVLGDIV